MSDIAVAAISSVVECPICLRPLAKPHKCKTLYGVKVCSKCRHGFANRRQAAYIVDAILFYLLSTAIVHVVDHALGINWSTRPGAPRVYYAEVMSLVMSIIVLPFLFTLKDSFNGRSLGKAMFGVQVVDVVSRKPIGPMQSIKRNLLLMIPYVGFIGAVLTMMKGQRWGDTWANTMVMWNNNAYKVPFSPEGRYCRKCGYDLTGNVSGRCPECGLDILKAAVRVCCQHCRFDLTGNASWWCPRCGGEVRGATSVAPDEVTQPTGPYNQEFSTTEAQRHREEMN